MLIEQAIFTSLRSRLSEGYQLAAASPGVGKDDARELSAWGPSHGSLLHEEPGASSINFHPLPSGRYCVSRTVAGGDEYSGRGGSRIYTQCFVIPTQVLGNFANNPFSLLRAIFAKGVMRVHEEIPTELAPFRLVGRARAMDAELVNRTVAEIGTRGLAYLIQSAISATTLCLTGTVPPEALVATLLNCLPVGARPEISFSTGLRFSPRRPFGILAAPLEGADQRQLQKRFGATTIDPSMPPPDVYCPTGWAALVQCSIDAGQLEWLAQEMEANSEPRALNDLEGLAAELGPALRGRTLSHQGSPNGSVASPPEQEPDPVVSAHFQQAHAPHLQAFESSRSRTAVLNEPVRPATRLADQCAELKSRFEQLDGAVYAVMEGQNTALQQVKLLWTELLSEAESDTIEKCREEYLRYAIALWTTRPGDRISVPDQALAALDVLCLMFEQ